MNKCLISIFLCCLYCSLTMAQEVTTPRANQLGLNITGLLTQLPILPNDGEAAGLYAVLYKQESKKKPGRFSRFGLGGKVGVGSFNNSALTISLGIDRPLMSEGRWHLYYGFDGLLFFENSSFSATVGIGYGPLAGVRFDLSKRVSLMTEGSAFLTISAGPSAGLAFTLRPPTGLFLLFRF